MAAAAPEASTDLSGVDAGVGPPHHSPFDRAEAVGSFGGARGRIVETSEDPDTGDARRTPPEPPGDLDIRTAGIGQLLDSTLEGAYAATW